MINVATYQKKHRTQFQTTLIATAPTGEILCRKYVSSKKTTVEIVEITREFTEHWTKQPYRYQDMVSKCDEILL